LGLNLGLRLIVSKHCGISLHLKFFKCNGWRLLLYRLFLNYLLFFRLLLFGIDRQFFFLFDFFLSCFWLGLLFFDLIDIVETIVIKD